MDKYELKVTISEIDSLISKRRFREAAEVVEMILASGKPILGTVYL